ncbi:Myb/SANT-like domain - like 1 [Theobroma cacao]|nr:Myb/SANT-like domain - like 1 [Theobroma cacao]
MTHDPLEDEMDEEYTESEAMENADTIQYIETSNAWTTWRNNLAQEMWNMEVASSQGLGRTSKRSTHQWTPIENGVLIDCCIDLVNEGSWGRDNGTFKPGYLQQLEQWMKERIPNCNIKAIPHIYSRMRLLKTQYREIAEMISHSASGFGWDDVKKCVTCDDDVWIDRATGEGAESPTDAVENIETEEVAFVATRVASEAFNALNVDEDENGDDDVSPAQATKSEGSTAVRRRTTEQGDREVSRKKTKSKSNGNNIGHAFQSSVDKIGEICQGAREGIDKLASCFQFMVEDARLKNRVIEIVQGVEGLTPEEIVKAGHIISSDMWKINYLFSLLEELQKIYVKALLSGSI